MALIKCTECGREVSDKASVCPNCGAPVVKTIKCEECGQQMPFNVDVCPNCGYPVHKVMESPKQVSINKATSTPSQSAEGKRGIRKVRKIIIGFSLFALIFSILYSNIHEDSQSEKEYENMEIEWQVKCSTVEKVKGLIENTTWTYTQPIEKGDKFDQWCKLEFKGGKLYYYEVSPSEGEWGEPKICDYTIEERRYSNTGEKYIGVFWTSLWQKYVFVPSERSISFQTSSGYVFGAYLRKEDAFPWN